MNKGPSTPSSTLILQSLPKNLDLAVYPIGTGNALFFLVNQYINPSLPVTSFPIFTNTMGPMSVCMINGNLYCFSGSGTDVGIGWVRILLIGFPIFKLAKSLVIVNENCDGES